MTTVVISPSNVVTFPEGGGHFWVYMQYVQGFLRQGCEVYWLERFVSSGDRDRDSHNLKVFSERMQRFGLGENAILYTLEESKTHANSMLDFIGIEKSAADALFQRADLLLNFHYAMDPGLLTRFQRTALVDIDPGLLQFWINTGQLVVSKHDFYFSTGETVGTNNAMYPDCKLPWVRIHPSVCLELWPYSYDPACETFTTISSWWGGDGKGEFITDEKDILYENNKRVMFLQYADLPRLTTQALELALNLGDGDPGEHTSDDDKDESTSSNLAGVTDYVSDAIDREMLHNHGWGIRNAYEVAGSPKSYQAYIQGSRGEFSCAKPSCLKFQNAWVSDRTICYLASGKPVVVQDTGPSSYLPGGEGMFRFSTIDEAIEAFACINANYEKHCQSAREIAETYFDVQLTVSKILASCRI